MPLTAGNPTFTAGTPGNVYGGATGIPLAAGATTTQTFAFGTAPGSGSGLSGSSALSGLLQVLDFGGATVGNPNGLQATLFRSGDGVNYSSVAYAGVAAVVGTVVSTTTSQDFNIEPGYYQIVLKNLDLANAIRVGVTLGVWN